MNVIPLAGEEGLNPLIPHPIEIVLSIVVFGLLFLAGQEVRRSQLRGDLRRADLRDRGWAARRPRPSRPRPTPSWPSSSSSSPTPATRPRASARRRASRGRRSSRRCASRPSRSRAASSSTARRRSRPSGSRRVTSLRAEVGTLATSLAGRIVGREPRGRRPLRARGRPLPGRPRAARRAPHGGRLEHHTEPADVPRPTCGAPPPTPADAGARWPGPASSRLHRDAGRTLGPEVGDDLFGVAERAAVARPALRRVRHRRLHRRRRPSRDWSARSSTGKIGAGALDLRRRRRGAALDAHARPGRRARAPRCRRGRGLGRGRRRPALRRAVRRRPAGQRAARPAHALSDPARSADDKAALLRRPARGQDAAGDRCGSPSRRCAAATAPCRWRSRSTRRSRPTPTAQRVAEVRVAQELERRRAGAARRGAEPRSTAAPVHLNVVVDPDVIGGMRVEIGDDVIDGTVVQPPRRGPAPAGRLTASARPDHLRSSTSTHQRVGTRK